MQPPFRSHTILASILALLFLLQAVPPALRAGSPSGPSESDEAIRSFFDAWRRAVWSGDANALAAALHPEALDEIKTFLLLLAMAEEPCESLWMALGIVDRSSLQALSPTEVGQRFLSAAFPHPPSGVPPPEDQLGYIGFVRDGELCHVVFRPLYGNVDDGLETPAVLTLQRDGNRWKARRTLELRAALQALAEEVDR